MTTNININVDLAGILERLKRQQQASRGAQVQREVDRRFAEEVKRILDQAQAQQQSQFVAATASGGNRTPLRRDELSAFRRPGDATDVTVAVGWITNGRLYSGDGTAFLALPDTGVELETPPAPLDPTPVDTCDQFLYPSTIFDDNIAVGSSQASGVEFVLPAGGDRLLYVFSYRSAAVLYYYFYKRVGTFSEISNTCFYTLPYTLEFEWQTSGQSAGCKAYLVGKDFVDEVDPGALGALLPNQHSSYTITTTEARPFGTPPDTPTYTRPGISLVPASNDTSLGYYGTSGTRLGTYGFGACTTLGGYTPIIFDTIFADLSDFGFSFSASNNYALIDAAFPNTSRCPFVTEVPAPVNSTALASAWRRPFYSGLSVVDCSGLRTPDLVVDVTAQSTPGNLVGAPDLTPLSAWDWNDPSYCRQRLASLGIAA